LTANLHASINELMRSHRWQQAIELLNANGDSFATDYELSWNLGWAYFQSERFSEAVAPLENALRLQPERAASHWALAATYLTLDRLDRAVDYSKAALKLRDVTIARQILALAYMQLGDTSAAEAVHKEGLDLQPTSPQRWQAYADFLSDLHRDEEADHAYRKAKELGFTEDLDPTSS
jgi:Tfp pilus assembly protein PilF